MEEMAREYGLFKTFTEVQRLVETKGLVPVVTLRMRQTVYQHPDPARAAASAAAAAAAAAAHAGSIGGGGEAAAAAAAAAAVRVQLDTDIQALLEYSTDGQVS